MLVPLRFEALGGQRVYPTCEPGLVRYPEAQYIMET